MKTAGIVYNPEAGNANHSIGELLDILKKSGYTTNYISIEDDNWIYTHTPFDIIFLAGGDGTIRKFASILLQNDVADIPIYVLPVGTANNIAKTLKIPGAIPFYEVNLQETIQNFDCGRITGLNNSNFFLESVGFGIFPQLIFEMRKRNVRNGDATGKLKLALTVLLDIVKKFKTQKVKIKADGLIIKGSFLLVELMNIQYLGPNVKLAPYAHPGDGYFELIMISEEGRAGLENFLDRMIKDQAEIEEIGKFVYTIPVKKVKIKCEKSKVHIDDCLISDYSGTSIDLEVIPNALKFMKNVKSV